jgi:hypothetical protein
MYSKNDLSSGCSASFSVNNFNFKPLTTSIVVGGRNCGKTTFIINKIYRDICDSIDNLYVFTSKHTSNIDAYSQITDVCYDTVDFPSIYSLIKKTNESNPDNKTLLIFDDILIKNETKTMLDKLIFNTRQDKITLILCYQYMPKLDFDIKEYIDYYVITQYFNDDILKSLYETLFGMFPTLAVFKDFFGCLSQHDFCVLDRGISTGNKKHIMSIVKAKLFSTYKKICSDVAQEQLDELKNKSVSNEYKIILEELNETIDKLVDLRYKLKKIMKK